MKLFPTTTHRDNWRRFLKSKARIKSFAKGETVFLQGQKPEYMYIIKSGIMRVYDISHEGEEHTVAFDVINEIFPIGWVFGEIELTQYFYDAWTDVDVYQLRREDFLRYLRFHPKMAYELYAITALRFTSLQQRILALEQSRASDKILHTFSYLATRFGKESSGNTTEISLNLTQQEIANMLGLTRETTSTELKKLEREKIIVSKNKRYEINIAKLQHRINRPSDSQDGS